MSRSSRKRNSKWDLKEVAEPPLSSVQGDGWPRESSLSFHGNESQPRRYSSDVADRKERKWGLRKNDGINEDRVGPWDGDESYSMKMSPGLDEWRQQRRTLSPKYAGSRSRRGRSRSRSRSRSPGHGFKWESGDRSRNRSGVVDQVCRDFPSGRCRRGDRCQFLHHRNHDYEDRRHVDGGRVSSEDSRPARGGASRYPAVHDTKDYSSKNERSVDYCNNFLKGKCWKGESCKYVHHSASDGNEVFRDGLKDRQNRDTSSERVFDRESRRGGDVPCRFYAAGNCRNGKYCRFSHHGESYSRFDERSHDDRWKRDHDLGSGEELTREQNFSDSNNVCSEARNGKISASAVAEGPVPSMVDELGCRLDTEKALWDPKNDAIPAESNKNELFPCRAEITAPDPGVSKSMGSEKSLGEMENSSTWNYRIRSSEEIVQGESEYVDQNPLSLTFSNKYIPTHTQDMTQEASSQMHPCSVSIQPIIYEKSFPQHNPNSGGDNSLPFPCGDRNAIINSPNMRLDLCFPANELPYESFNQINNNLGAQPLPVSSLDVVGQSQLTVLPSISRGQISENLPNHVQYPGEESKRPDHADTNTSQVTSGIFPFRNSVSSEQLAQLTNLSASLAQLLESGQQLPNLYAAHNSTIAMEPMAAVPNSGGPVTQLATAFVQPNLAIGSQKQPNALSSASVMDFTPSLSNSAGPVTQVAAISVQPNLVVGSQQQYDPLCDSIEHNKSGELNGGSASKIGILEDLSQAKSVAKYEAGGSNEMETQESQKFKEHKSTHENDLLVNIEENDKDDVSKKSKEAKGIRAFKFALAEFVKELLKPTWKDGQINKDVYKIVVKKVVDKVTSTMQGAHIPQNQEKINNYLSVSKPKLTKLVQAYVERHQKS